MRKPVFLLVLCVPVLCAFSLTPGACAQRFDGHWSTKLTCPPKGNTEGYTWQFVSVIQSNLLHGERGTAGEPGYYTLDGKIADNGSAKLTGSGIVASRQYARGAFAHKGADYSYDVKAQFEDAAGTGTRSEGLGIVGRTCTFEFTKQPPTEGASPSPGGPGHQIPVCVDALPATGCYRLPAPTGSASPQPDK